MLDLKSQKVNWPEEKEDTLNPADDREASKESHGASDETQLGLSLDILVSLDVVEGGRVKVDLHQLQGWCWQLLTWRSRVSLWALGRQEYAGW